MTCFYAVEDALSAALVKRTLSHSIGDVVDLRPLGPQRGCGPIRANLGKYCHLASQHRVVVVTDLDQAQCPVSLIANWFGSNDVPGNMVFRVAVREAEAWVMADREGFAEFLGVPSGRLTRSPEELADPKAALISLARRARREVRYMIVPEPGSQAAIGREYNDALCDFVMNRWDVDAASGVAPSLARAIARIQHQLG